MSSRIIPAESPDLSRVLPFSFLSGFQEHSTQTTTPPPDQSDTFSGPSDSQLVDDSSVSDCGTPPVSDSQELILRHARTKAAELEKEGYEKGFAEGERAGKEIGEKMVEATLKQYASTLDELKNLRQTVLNHSEQEVVRLALEVAKKVVKREVSIDDELILALVRVALSRLADQSVMTVRLNPKDCQSILRQRQSAGPRDPLHEGIRLQEDPLISRGGCVIETESGVIDGRIEEQFREIEKGFFE